MLPYHFNTGPIPISDQKTCVDHIAWDSCGWLLVFSCICSWQNTTDWITQFFLSMMQVGAKGLEKARCQLPCSKSLNNLVQVAAGVWSLGFWVTTYWGWEMWSKDGASEEVVISPFTTALGEEKMSNCENERERGNLALLFNISFS